MIGDALPTLDAAQILSLEGVQNFREVGGYPTRDGGRLRRGLIWRSARINAPADSDLVRILAQGIKTIADLRRPRERNSQPTHPLLLSQHSTLTWNVEPSDDGGARRALLDPDADDGARFEALCALYRRLPEQYAQQIRDICTALIDGAAPILIHCAAGKDRTGVVVALLLEMVGVKRAHVIADFAKTEDLLDWSRLTGAAAVGMGGDRSWVERLPPDARTMLFRSDPRYLSAALNDMERRAGTVEHFAIKRLGIPCETICQLRAVLVHDAD